MIPCAFAPSIRRIVALLVACVTPAAACSATAVNPAIPIDTGAHTSAAATHAITPIPEPVGLDPLRVALGQRLFRDRALSRDGTISCASCHDLERGGDDGRARSLGIGGALGRRNAPTVFNAALHFRQFWDGRAQTLEAQVDGPTHDALEMASSWPRILATLEGSAQYRTAFGESYPDGITAANVRDAIATFERSLLTPGSRFDRFLRGDQNALSADERAGYQVFQDQGCVSCHQGVAMGGNMFETFGALVPLDPAAGPTDQGRYELTRDDDDRSVFKVPSLRNVGVTAPYFHDGSVATLDRAVRIMAHHQLGREPSETEVQSLVAFLGSLTGRYQGRSL